jgi:hypothetical protein
MLDFDDHVDIAPRIKIGPNFHKKRITGGDKIIQNDVNHFFVGNIAIAEGIGIKLEGFEFDYFLVGTIVNIKGRKIGIP